MTGHAAGQRQASLESSPLPPTAFPEKDQSELTEEDAMDRNPAEEALTKSTPS